jgi:adhesin/invasin
MTPNTCVPEPLNARMHPFTSIAVVSMIALAAACSSDSPTTPVATTGDTTKTAAGVTVEVDSASANQTVTVGTATTVRVHVTQSTTPVSGATVTWAVTGGGGSVSAASSITDATGVASVVWTMGDTVGTNTLSATASGATIVVTDTSLVGAISSLVKVSPDSQAVVSGGLVALNARAVDRFGNGVPSVAINWTTTDGSLSTTATTSGLKGSVTTNLLTGSAPATYFVTAVLPGLASVTFKVVGL